MRTRIAIAPLAALLLLTSCAPSGSSPTSAPDDSPSVSSTPKPEETESPESDVLFTIEAHLADSLGGTIVLTYVGHEPQDSDAPGRENITTTYIEKCNALGGGSLNDVTATLSPALLDQYGSSLMVSDLRSTPAATGMPVGVYLLLGSPYYYQVAYGDVFNDGSSGCYQNNLLVATGAATAITNYETGNSTSNPEQWLIGSYGFYLPPEDVAYFSACGIEYTDLAHAKGLDTAPGWNVDLTSDKSCIFGYAGE